MRSSATITALRNQAISPDGSPRPLIVRKAGWSKRYCVFILGNKDGRFYGHSYLNGVFCCNVSLSENENGFLEYEGSEREPIIHQEKELLRNALSASTTETHPSCDTCIYQVSGECGSWNLCDAYMPIPYISEAKRANWPKYGQATAIKKREAKKHSADGAPTFQ